MNSQAPASVMCNIHQEPFVLVRSTWVLINVQPHFSGFSICVCTWLLKTLEHQWHVAVSAAFVCTVEYTNFMEATSDYFCCPTSAINVLNMAIAGRTLHQTEKWPLILCENVCVFQQNLEISWFFFHIKAQSSFKASLLLCCYKATINSRLKMSNKLIIFILSIRIKSQIVMKWDLVGDGGKSVARYVLRDDLKKSKPRLWWNLLMHDLRYFTACNNTQLTSETDTV